MIIIKHFDALLYKPNINCHFLTLTSYLLYKTDYGCSTVLHLCLLRVGKQEETLLNVSTCVCACAWHGVKPQWILHVTKNGEIYEIKYDWLYTIICLSLNDTGVSQQMAFFLGHPCICFPIISSKCSKILYLLRSRGTV